MFQMSSLKQSRNRKAQSKTRWCFYGTIKLQNVVPDFAIRIVDGELELTLNGEMPLAYMFLKIIKK
jgi:hypothetical protein